MLVKNKKHDNIYTVVIADKAVTACGAVTALCALSSAG